MHTDSNGWVKSAYPHQMIFQNAPHNNLEHGKFKDWEEGKATGANGHIFF